MTLEVFIIKILKKFNFSEIHLVGFWQTLPNFWTAIQDMLKITVPPLSQHNSRKRVLRLLGDFLFERAGYHLLGLSSLVRANPKSYRWNSTMSVLALIRIIQKLNLPMYHITKCKYCDLCKRSDINAIVSSMALL